MFTLSCFKNNDIINDVRRSGNPIKHILNCVLKDLTCTVCSKVEMFVLKKSFVCCKSCYVARFFVKLKLLVSRGGGDKTQGEGGDKTRSG